MPHRLLDISTAINNFFIQTTYYHYHKEYISPLMRMQFYLSSWCSSICYRFGVWGIGHVRYINIQAWLRGFRVKIANFSSFFCPSIPIGDLDTKGTTPNIEVWPESIGAMLEYWYIERGLLFLLFYQLLSQRESSPSREQLPDLLLHEPSYKLKT